MRTALITACVLTLLSAALCGWSVHYISDATDALCALTDRAAQAVSAGDAEAAEHAVRSLSERWEQSHAVLEMLSGHEDLHRVSERLTEARSHMEHGGDADALACLALLKEALVHIRDSESFSFANLL